MEPFEYHGMWRKPRGKRSLPGTLKFDGKELRLKLQGTLSEHAPEDHLETYPIVLGNAPNDTANPQITLIGVHPYSLQESGLTARRLVVEEARVSEAIVGAHFRTQEELTFDEAQIGFDKLGEWVDRYSFQVSDAVSNYTVRYNRILLPKAVTPFGSVEIGVGAHFSLGFSHEMTLREELSFYTRFTTRQTLADIHRRWIYPLQNFLTFATREPVSVTNVELYRAGRTYVKKAHLRPLKLYYSRAFIPVSERSEIRWVERLFRFSDVEDLFSTVAERWLDESEHERDFMGVYFGMRYSPPAYDSARLLTLILALEAYHRSKWPNHLQPKSDFRKRLTRIVSHAPADEQAWLRHQLQYSNEPRLRDRLVDMLLQNEATMGPLVGDIEAFAQKAAKARNSVVHGARRAAESDDLYWTVHKLDTLVEALLLTNLGIPTHRQLEIFEKCEPYRIVRRFGQQPQVPREPSP